MSTNQALLDAVSMGDWERYCQLCCDDITCFEPEAKGHLVSGLPFHRCVLNSPPISCRLWISRLMLPKVLLRARQRPRCAVFFNDGKYPIARHGINCTCNVHPTGTGMRSCLFFSFSLKCVQRVSPANGFPETTAFNETRLWKRSIENGISRWKNVHFHRSPVK